VVICACSVEIRGPESELVPAVQQHGRDAHNMDATREVFVLRLGGRGLELTGPCGPDAWYLEVGEDDDPVAAVTAASRA